MLMSSVTCDVISFILTRKCQKIRKLMEIAHAEKENLHIFWTACGVSMNFSRKKWLMTISKVTKKQNFTLSLKNWFLEKPEGCQFELLGLKDDN